MKPQKIEMTQDIAEDLVYKSLLTEYTDEQIKDMPYRVVIKGDKIHSIGATWEDVYLIEYQPVLKQI